MTILLRSIPCLAVLFFSGCQNQRVSEVGPQLPTSLIWAVPSLVPLTHWNRCQHPECYEYASLIMEGLTRYEWKDSTWILSPRLASQWKWESPLEITLSLRSGVVWNDGSPLKPHHFLNAWQRILLSREAKKLHPLFFPIRGAEAIAIGKAPASTLGVRASDSTLSITLTRPLPSLPARFAHPAFWPERDPLQPYTVTLGPYTRIELSPLNARLIRNGHYNGERPFWDELSLIEVRSRHHRIEQFFQQETDFVVESADEVSSSFLRQGFDKVIPTGEIVTLAIYPHHPLVKTRTQAAHWVSSIHLPELHSILTPFCTAAPSGRRLDPPKIKPAFSSMEHPPTLIIRRQTPLLENVAANLRAQWIKNLGVLVGEPSSGTPATFVIEAVNPRFDTNTFEGTSENPLESLSSLFEFGAETWLDKAFGSNKEWKNPVLIPLCQSQRLFLVKASLPVERLPFLSPM